MAKFATVLQTINIDITSAHVRNCTKKIKLTNRYIYTIVAYYTIKS